MKCPACGQILSEMELGEVVVDACKNGCGGVWFDQFELQRVDEKGEDAGNAIQELEGRENADVRNAEKRECPRCKDVVMRQRYYGVAKQDVEIDECPGCGGIWLDSGELQAIRDQYPPGVDRDRAEQEYWQEKVGRRFDSLAGTYRNMAEAMRRARERRRRNMHWSHSY